ncbi:MAG TPA: M3 family metallopeptidase [Symbiobacteriaceae bacterium]|nr:M3 family metallopeptidase [Symbiobacteriaceae bacterium]
MTYRQTWDLAGFFKGNEWEETVAFLEAQLAILGQKTAALTPENLDGWCELFAIREQLARLNYQVHDYILCCTAQNVGDSAAWQRQERLSRLAAGYNAERIRLHEQMRRMLPERWEQLLADKRVREIAFPLRQIRADLEDQLPPEQQQLVNDLTSDGYEAWGRLYQRIAGRIRVPFQGESLSLGQVAGRLAGPDRAALQQSLEAALEPEAELCAEALNHMTGFRLALYRRRGFDSVLTEALRRNRMSQASLDAMWAAVDTARPKLNAYMQRKARLLGQSDFCWHDADAPVGALVPAMPYDEAAGLVVREFSRFSPGLGALADRAFREGWVEAEDRSGKRPGGFCTVFPLQEQSRIFLTYGQGPMGPSALAHELGHAYHYHVSAGLPMLLREAPMTLAETASTFAETVVSRARIAQSQDRAVRVALLDEQIRTTLGYLPGIRARFLFELRAHEARQKGPLSAEHLNRLMADAQREAFGPAMASGFPQYWMTKLHFFLPVPFYNFPYTVGYLLAAALYARAQVDPGFDLGFKLFLRDTGRDTVEEVVRRHLGADIAGPEFWLSAVQVLMQDVDEFLTLTAG